MLLSRRKTMCLLGAASAAGLAGWPLPAVAREWTSAHFAGNPLVGQVFDQNGKSDVSLEALKDKAAASRYVMLGEIHPNPDHHLLQAEFLDHMVAKGRKPAVVFEMLTRAEQPVLDKLMASPSIEPGTIAQRLNWNASGWPDFAMYQPLFETALKNGLRLQAGNLEKSTVRRLGGRVGSKLSDAERATLGLDKPLPEAAGKAMLEVIRTSHCNMLPDTVLPFMRDIQRARDLVMAAAMLDDANTDGAVLICGSGHARLDWGAGYLVERDAPGKLLSIAFSEVYSDMASDIPAHDGHHFTVLTPKQDVTDHCAAFKQRKSVPN
ncbi:MAG: ChaN family lipoprotein [Anderseniella sp.]|nr:ChaN family lipoprotein [Anderseniella sp.]